MLASSNSDSRWFWFNWITLSNLSLTSGKWLPINLDASDSDIPCLKLNSFSNGNIISLINNINETDYSRYTFFLISYLVESNKFDEAQRITNELDYLNKRAVFVYLRDISGLTPKQLSVSMSNIRKHYKDIKKTNKNHYSFSIFLD